MEVKVKAQAVNIEKPFHRLYFGFIQFFLGIIGLVAVFFLFPNVFAIAYNLFLDVSITGSIVRAIGVAFVIGIYLNLREMFISYGIMKDLIHIEGGNKLEKEEDSHASTLMVLMDEFKSFSAERLDGDPARDYIEIMMTHSNGVNKILNFMASILPMLGLLGTILGLLRSITGLTDFGATQADILSGVQVILGGMGTSFYSTVVGLALMIALRYLNLISRHMRQVVYSDIYKFLRYKI